MHAYEPHIFGSTDGWQHGPRGVLADAPKGQIEWLSFHEGYLFSKRGPNL